MPQTLTCHYLYTLLCVVTVKNTNMMLNYYLARTPQEVTDFVNKGNTQVASIVKDGEYFTVFYWME